MAHIHGIKTEKYGFFDNTDAKTGTLVGLHSTYHDFIHTGLDENVQRLITFKILTDDQARKFKQLFDQINFEPSDGPRLIQNDMADWNLLTDGKKITGILDWDECHSGDPIADIACWSTFFSIERLKFFLIGYKTVATLPEDYESRFHFYRLRYTISKMALRCKRYEVDKSKFVAEKIKVGKQALIEESHWFNL